MSTEDIFAFGHRSHKCQVCNSDGRPRPTTLLLSNGGFLPSRTWFSKGKCARRCFRTNKLDRLTSTSPYLHQFASIYDHGYHAALTKKREIHGSKSGRRNMKSAISAQRVTSSLRAGKAALTARHVYFLFTPSLQNTIARHHRIATASSNAAGCTAAWSSTTRNIEFALRSIAQLTATCTTRHRIRHQQQQQSAILLARRRPCHRELTLRPRFLNTHCSTHNLPPNSNHEQ